MIKAVYGVAQNGERVKLDFNEIIFVNEADCEINIRTMTHHPDNLDLYLQIMADEQDTDIKYLYAVPGACNLLLLKALKRSKRKGVFNLAGDKL